MLTVLNKKKQQLSFKYNISEWKDKNQQLSS